METLLIQSLRWGPAALVPAQVQTIWRDASLRPQGGALQDSAPAGASKLPEAWYNLKFRPTVF